MKTFHLVAVAILATPGTTNELIAQTDGSTSAGATGSNVRTVPAGTLIDAALARPISAADSRAGDKFVAHVSQPVMATDGGVLIPAGAAIEGTISSVNQAYGAFAPASVRVTVRTITVNGRTSALHARVRSTTLPKNPAQPEQRPRTHIGGTEAGTILLAAREREGADGSSEIARYTRISLGPPGSRLRLPAGTVFHLRIDDPVPVPFLP